MITTAMILAAGRGERLRPLTDSIPKPLVEVGGEPLICRHIRLLREAGIRTVVINTAWLGEKLEEALGDGSAFGVAIRWSREIPGGLETAGGLRQALPLLGDRPFLAVNGDTFMDLDYRLFTAEDPRRGGAHLWLIPNPPHHPGGDFSLEGMRLLGAPGLTFSGAAVYSPSLIARIPEERLPLKPWILRWIAEGAATGELLPGAWFDVGTMERLAQVREYASAGARF